MKNFYLIFFRRQFFCLIYFGLIFCMKLSAQWISETSPTTANLNSISTLNEEEGWIVGDNGTILSKIGGDWIQQFITSQENLNSVYMLDRNSGWIVGANGTILKYNGSSWQPSFSPTKKDLLSVHFSDSENGVAVGENGLVLFYRGGNWIESDIRNRANLNTAFHLDKDIWLAGGLENVKVPIMKMSNENPHMQDFDSFNFATINSIYILSDLNGWAVGSPSTLIHFDGFKWGKADISESFPSLRSVYFTDERNGISVGFEGTILIFSDGKWTKDNSNSTQNLNSASINGNYYYAVGEQGTIIKKLLPKNNNSMDNVNFPLNSIVLYPNPCDEMLNLLLPNGSSNAIVRVLIFNSLGQIVLKHEFSLENAGYSYPLNTSNLKDGIYILELIINDRTFNRKFIVQH